MLCVIIIETSLKESARSPPQSWNPFGQCHLYLEPRLGMKPEVPRSWTCTFCTSTYEYHLNSVTFSVRAGNSEADLELLRS